jgi:hypothetical protein
MRERLIHERTAKSNQVKSMVAEEDFIFPVDLIQLKQAIVALVYSSDGRTGIADPDISGDCSAKPAGRREASAQTSMMVIRSSI